ncbi:MAG: hypothetical protein EBS19_08615 [Spirochaetia bacterium]|nr:hypothetical protein [Spirochaetia bacterium]
MEDFLSISNMQKGTSVSDSFRKKLVERGYRKFDGKPIKGEICYDAYHRDFSNSDGLKYTIYCYCYDLKDIVPNPEVFEFSFEVQLNAGIGIIGLEAIQWDFRTEENAELNIAFFELRVDSVWKALGSIKFPT